MAQNLLPLEQVMRGSFLFLRALLVHMRQTQNPMCACSIPQGTAPKIIGMGKHDMLVGGPEQGRTCQFCEHNN